MIAPHDTSHMHEVNGHSDENRSASLLLHWAKPTGRSFVNRCYNMPTHLLIPLQPNDSLLARVLPLNASMKNEIPILSCSTIIGSSMKTLSKRLLPRRMMQGLLGARGVQR